MKFHSNQILITKNIVKMNDSQPQNLKLFCASLLLCTFFARVVFVKVKGKFIECVSGISISSSNVVLLLSWCLS